MPAIPDYYLPLMYGGTGLLGLVCCFFGYRLFKLMIVSLMAVTGAAVLAWLGFEYGEQPLLWSAGGLVLGAILGGVLALFFYSLAVATIGALFAATALLPWVQAYSVGIQWTVLGIASLAAALLATVLTNLMIQLASAMLGALLLVHSALYFFTGQTIHTRVEGETGWSLQLQLDPYVAGTALVIGLLGFLVQHRSAAK